MVSGFEKLRDELGDIEVNEYIVATLSLVSMKLEIKPEEILETIKQRRIKGGRRGVE